MKTEFDHAEGEWLIPETKDLFVGSGQLVGYPKRHGQVVGDEQR
ncbi:MAG: hypothetical protein WCE90_01440 [Candidatus Zixiibacteriota bacterium]